MLIREAGDSDVETVTRLRVAFVADHRGVPVDVLEPHFVSSTRSFVEQEQACGRLRSWLADDEGEAVGVVSLLLTEMPPRPGDPRTREGYVLNMYVSPSARRRGLGAALFAACTAGAAAAGVRRVVLHATDDGRGVYERAGFRTNDAWMELRIPR